MTSSPALSIIIPVFNEAATIQEVIARVLAASLPTGWQRELVVVDDGSTDETGELLKEYEGIHRVIRRAANGGKGRAIKDGLSAATGRYALIQDADLEYSPEDYQTLLAPIEQQEASVVFGSRVLGHNNVPYRRMYYHGGLFLTKLFNVCFKTRLTDLATCYKAFPLQYRDTIVALPSDDFVFDVVELSRFLAAQGSITEVPIRYESRGRAKGKKLSLKHGLRCVIRIIQLYVGRH